MLKQVFSSCGVEDEAYFGLSVTSDWHCLGQWRFWCRLGLSCPLRLLWGIYVPIDFEFGNGAVALAPPHNARTSMIDKIQ